LTPALTIYRQCHSQLGKRFGDICDTAVPPAVNRRCEY
jgi:hypothetical protein